MKVLQLIDSLHPGGAERMAVTIANALVSHNVASYLCTTREEGLLKQQLKAEVYYFHLKKNGALDMAALLRLRAFVLEHKITIIHAHTTSYFFATLLKISYPKLMLIWHEHQGNRISTTRTENPILYICSFFYSRIITVNDALQRWCTKNLAVKSVVYLPNFVLSFNLDLKLIRNKRIVCLANLKFPKNHQLLLKAFAIVHLKYPDWKLQLVGKDYKDTYSTNLRLAITGKINESIIFTDSGDAVEEILLASAIGVLSSNSEGLPVALLEYGVAALAVVCTDVGQCRDVIDGYGKIVPPHDAEALAQAILFYIENEAMRISDGLAFSRHILKNYADDAIIPKLLDIYKETGK